tara:strand:+ start:564 stop:731 length:168 start_codon:yes stop_codon:yes gene_type:complete
MCHSLGWHIKGFKRIASSATCTSYIIAAYRAAPHDPILAATSLASSPLETAVHVL